MMLFDLPEVIPQNVDTRPLWALVQRACTLLIVHQPKDKPYIGAFSGGKDSVVIKHLALLAGVNVEWHYRVTTIDPPELVAYIREHHPDVIFDRPRKGGMFRRIREKGEIPSRRCRWCCREFKETEYAGETTIIGVRIAESTRRKALWTQCTMTFKKSTVMLPVRLWPDDAVWKFIHAYKLPYCSLYDEGFKRLGCILCPLQGRNSKNKEMDRWPKHTAAWKAAFRSVWDRRKDAKHNQLCIALEVPQ